MKYIKRIKHADIDGLRCGYSPIGKPRLLVNIYLVDGLLVDTGQIKMQKDIMAFLSDFSLEQVLVTHYHEDHTGNISAIKEKYNICTKASQKCVQMMLNPPSISLPQNMYWGNRPPEQLEALTDQFIKTSKYSFEIISLPGHTDDMIGLFEKNMGWFFSGDLYINSYIGYILKEESILQQIESLKCVLKLDFNTLLCAHNPHFYNGKTKLKEKLSFLQQFYYDVAKLYNRGYSPFQIFKTLKLKENWGVRIFSNGALSKMNMVNSVIRDERILKNFNSH